MAESFVCTYQGCFADGRIPTVGDFVAGVRNDTDAIVRCYFVSREQAQPEETCGVSPGYVVVAHSTLLLQPAEWIALRGECDVYLLLDAQCQLDDRVQACLAHTQQPSAHVPVSLPMRNGCIVAPPAGILALPLREPQCVNTQTGELYVQCCSVDCNDNDDDNRRHDGMFESSRKGGWKCCTSAPNSGTQHTGCLSYHKFARYIHKTHAGDGGGWCSPFYDCPHMLVCGDAEYAVHSQRFTAEGHACRKCFWCMDVATIDVHLHL